MVHGEHTNRERIRGSRTKFPVRTRGGKERNPEAKDIVFSVSGVHILQ